MKNEMQMSYPDRTKTEKIWDLNSRVPKQCTISKFISNPLPSNTFSSNSQMRAKVLPVVTRAEVVSYTKQERLTPNPPLTLPYPEATNSFRVQAALYLHPKDYTVSGILQPRILQWVAVPFSRGSSQPRDRTQVSLIARRFFII